MPSFVDLINVQRMFYLFARLNYFDIVLILYPESTFVRPTPFITNTRQAFSSGTYQTPNARMDTCKKLR
jgi:hypothetical protein